MNETFERKKYLVATGQSTTSITDMPRELPAKETKMQCEKTQAQKGNTFI
jgi:hypothetical protein